jgi:hypothetical protein
MTVPGISPSFEPELYDAAAELNAWINYLLAPASNDGPRIYRPRGVTGRTPSDLEMPSRVDNLEAQSNIYDTVSVLDAYAGDPEVFFRPAQAVSGLVEPTIETTYTKVATGYLTWAREDVTTPPDASGGQSGSEPQPVEDVEYPEMHPARFNWVNMRLAAGWTAPENLAAGEYEGDFIRFQVLTENCAYEVAKHLVRYRAIFMKAGEDIAKLMTALTEKFANSPVEGVGVGGGVDFDLKSIVITGVATALTTVLGGGVTAPIVLATAAVDTLGEAVKSARTTTRGVHVHPYFHDTAKQYIDGVDRIEREVADAVQELTDNMRTEVDRLRDKRRYEVYPGKGEIQTRVPHIRTYIESLPK